LFKTLINAYALGAGTKKYWRLNVSEVTPEHDEVVETGTLWWKKSTIVHHLDNFKDIGEMDDVGKIELIKAITTAYITAQQDIIDECGSRLRESLQ
jgi:hypothetical protein